MKRSTERFLTTHTGSLPRPDDLIRMMYAKEEGVPVDAARARAARRARGRRGRAQAGGRRRRHRQRRRDEQAELRHLHQGPAGRLRRRRQHVRLPGPGRLPEPRQARVRRPRPLAPQDARVQRGDRRARSAARAGRRRAPAGRARAGVDAQRSVHDRRRRPASISLFFRNEHYPSEEAYLFAIADAMRHEYETIADAGIVLQIDCPDLAHGTPHPVRGPDAWQSSARRRELHVEALNHALANIPPEQLRMHLCWGNYEGPHHCDVPLADIIDIVFLRAAERRSRSRPRTRATRTSGSCSRRVKLPDGKLLIPGRARIEDELHRASGARRAAHRPLREARRPRERDRRQRLRLRHLGRAGGRRSRRRVGQDGARWPKARASHRASSGSN